MRVSEPLRMAVGIDRSSGKPLCDQIVEQVRSAILVGTLAPGTRLPSTRMLADVLSVSRSVALSAFLQLHAEGLLVSRHGSGTYVCEGAPVDAGPPSPHRPDGVTAADGPAIDLTPGQPSTEHFPTAAWRAAWRQACHQPPSPVPSDVFIDYRLRRAVCTHLRIGREIVCEPEQILPLAGVRTAYEALAEVVSWHGGRIGVEEPGCPALRRALQARGVEFVPIPVDEDGVVVGALPPGLRYVVVTPSHQDPLGVRLSSERRTELLEWARRESALIVEHDCGSEFSYRTPPLPSILAMSDERDFVAYVGSFDHVLTPALGVSYLVLSTRLQRECTAPLAAVATPPLPMVERVLLELLEGGHVLRHTRRMRPVYERKRDLVERALGRLGAGTRLIGADAGLHCVLLLPADRPDTGVAAALRRSGVGVLPLSELASTPDSARNGLIIGYAGQPDRVLRAGLAAIAAEVVSPRPEWSAGYPG